MKKCSKCKELKDPTQFYRNRKNPDGRQYACKECKSAVCRQWREKNKKHIAKTNRKYLENNRLACNRRNNEYRKKNRERAAEWFQNYRENNRETLAEKQRAYYQENKQKVFARAAVSEAIRKGELTPPKTCSLETLECHGRIEAHHDDYNKPLDVKWLCTTHHNAWHRVFIAEEN